MKGEREAVSVLCNACQSNGSGLWKINLWIMEYLDYFGSRPLAIYSDIGSNDSLWGFCIVTLLNRSLSHEHLRELHTTIYRANLLD